MSSRRGRARLPNGRQVERSILLFDETTHEILGPRVSPMLCLLLAGGDGHTSCYAHHDQVLDAWVPSGIDGRSFKTPTGKNARLVRADRYDLHRRGYLRSPQPRTSAEYEAHQRRLVLMIQERMRWPATEEERDSFAVSLAVAQDLFAP